ncbi:Ig-like domain-containing protein [Chitinophaga sancti]|uniref:Gliding motility-associated C-terminal domain-containing protein n=1 Tax=Chitinophaga sancti TaxID=1004 RepID=A0A1K1SJ49_9BACT|nr:gliding motility-associated C-terminal domain-containing protein [Chitinophaga sancti]WQD61801.1 gliding motility-associated C-terminal domain-containing protein [Chitinophaga sancti]WQG92630.1 gliding motility-associated C-terminal domain-containing protein [Chitinophaga sancti]SFW83909.1 gliding motility-associated C-terminal domain-containing protein [Chitinophaga sancti]
MSKLKILCLGMIIALFPAQAAYSFNRIYVNVNNPTPGTGSSWATAYNDLAAALAAGNQADTFWVAQGTYLPTTTGDRTIAFAPKPSQVIYGGFVGTEVLLSQRNWKTNVTILSGDIGAAGMAGDNSYNVVRIINALVDGVTIRDGQADYGFPTLTPNQYNTGAGVSLFTDASVSAATTVAATVVNCTFTNNYAIYGAGFGALGIAATGVQPYLGTRVSKCIFIENTANTAGGAIAICYHGACVGNDYTDNSIFIGNKATSGHGAVIANILDGTTTQHRPWMDNVVFWENGEDLVYNSLANGATGGPYIEFAIIWRLGAKYGASNFSDANITWHDSDIYVDDANLPATNINTDPQFADGPGYDFHVAACSPVIDATILTAVGSSSTDYDGNPRVVKTVDMGIYESTKTISVAPTVATQYFCQNMTATPLVATGTSLLWYTSASGGTGSATAPTPLTTAAGDTYYYVTQTLIGECESVRSPLMVTVTPASAAPVATDVTYCTGATAVALTATGTNLKWYTSASGGTALAVAPTPATAVNGNTYYYVTQTEAGSCESARTPLLVTVTNNPPLPVVADVTYCEGSLTVPLTAVGTSLLWYNTPTGNTGVSAAPTPLTNAVGTTTYYVSQNVGCESGRAALNVIVNAIPAAPVAADITYCMGSTAAPLTATGTNLMWYTSIAAATGTSVAPTPSTAANGTTTYYVSQNTVCESDRAALNVTIGSQATPPVTHDLTYCQNAVASMLSASGTNLLWYTTATGGTGTSVAPTPSTVAVGATTYYVTQQDAGGCESNRAALTVTVNAQPAIPVVSDIAYCLNETVPPLTATGTALKWYTAAAGGTGSASAPIPVTLATGSTTYYVTQTAGCESERAALTVTINTSTSPVVSPLTLCQYATATPLEAGGTSLMWYTTATGGTGSAAAPTPSTLVTGTTIYYVSQTDGCESARAPLVVTVVKTPQPDFTTKGGCAGSPMTVTLLPDGSSTAIYTWNFYNAIAVTGNDPGPYKVLWRDPGTYTVTLTTYDGACESKVEKLVSVGLAPEITVTPVTGNYCINDTVTLRAAGAETYEWSPAGYLSSGKGDRVTATFRGDMKYTVTGTDGNGCVGTADVYLGLSPDCKIYYILPTAFSPNGDGLNDVFRVKTSDIPLAFVMRVFNRVGQLVFESHDIGEGWNGVQKGQQAPLGAYVYMISAVTSEGKHVEQSGSVVVTR